MKTFWTLSLFLFSCFALSAQTSLSTSDGPKVMVVTGGGFGTDMGPMTFAYKEVMRGGEFVKGAPYTATAITETTQVLADGNRIVNKSSAFLARDGEGRTRREETMSNAGPLPLNPMKMVFISDPTTSSEYLLNMMEKTADIMKPETTKITTLEQRTAMDSKLKAEKVARPQELGEIKRESLGTEVIEGLSCDHLLATQTIPAGTIGNEQPLVITSETWAAPELHLLVMRKHKDPRFGETSYRLTNISRGDPDPSLFQVPGDFKILDKLPPLRSPLQ
jgi:hypothetical protein